MTAMPSTPISTHSKPHHSAVWALVLAYGCLVVYASLYPFTSWTSNGLPWWDFVSYPWPPYWTWFDLVANLLGYLPLGLCITLAALREPGKALRQCAVPLGMVVPVLLSFVVEVLQNYLPMRVPSNVDWLLNSAGACLGAILAWGLNRVGLFHAWHTLQQRWFAPDAQYSGLVLLLLWPWALLHPLPVPFGLGQVQESLENWLGKRLADTPFIEWLPLRTIEYQPLLSGQIALVVAFGLWVPCLLAFDLIPAWRKRLPTGLSLIGAGILATALGHVLGMAPRHAWSWIWQPVQTGMLAGSACVLVSTVLPRLACRVLAALVLCTQLAVLNDAAVSAYFDWDLHTSWLPGQFIRFYGLTTWLGWLWPYAVLLYLLPRFASLQRRKHEKVADNT